VIKSSLPIVDFLDVTGHTRRGAHAALADLYRRQSSLFQQYQSRFLEAVYQLGWPKEVVLGAVQDAFHTPIAWELLQEIIPNSATLSDFRMASYYVPHN
jgi:hypothetical protein